VIYTCEVLNNTTPTTGYF